MTDNYIMYNGEKYDIPDSTLSLLAMVLKKKNRNPFWSKETIKIGDTYCDSSDSYIEERTYADYPIENSAITDARLMKTKKDAEVVYIRELLNRLLWRYKFKNDGDSTNECGGWHIIKTILTNGNVCWKVEWVSRLPVGCVGFRSHATAAAAIDDVVIPFFDDYGIDDDFIRDVLGIKE